MTSSLESPSSFRLSPTGSWWWAAATGLSLLWGATSTMIAFHLWSTKGGDNQRQDNHKTALTTANVLSQSFRPFGNSTGSIALLLGIGGCSLLWRTGNNAFQKSAQWILWCSGLLGLHAIQQYQQSVDASTLQPNKGMMTGRELGLDRLPQFSPESPCWILFYFMLFPSLSPSRRESDEVGPWLMACMMGIAALWRNFSVSEQNNIDSSTPPPPQDERRDRQTYGYVPDNDEEKIFDRSLGTFVREKRPPSESVVENSHPKTVASSEPFSGSQLDKSNKQYLEILVHNVSHTDLVLSLEADLDARASTIHTEERENMVSAEQVEPSTKNAPESRDPYCLCRPRFSFFDHYCRAVLENLTKEDEIVSFPRYQRAVDHPRYSILSEPSQGVPIPTGLHLSSTSRPVVADLHEVRVRGRDHIKVFPDGEPVPESDNGETVKFPVSHVFFPLLATLLPHWEQQITEKYRLQSVKRVLMGLEHLEIGRTRSRGIRHRLAQI